MSKIEVDSLTHTGNNSTDNLILASSGAVTTADDLTVGDNLVATKQNGCQRIILEQFYHPCDGSTIATSGGNVTLTDVTAGYTPTTSYTTTTGSEISYVPPTGTTMVIYKFNYLYSIVDDHNITHNKFFIDSDEVTYQRYTMSGHIHLATPVTVEICIPIGGTANTNTGRQASWSSAKTLKLTSRVYGSAQEAKHHATFYWDGTTGAHFRIPSIGITAIG